MLEGPNHAGTSLSKEYMSLLLGTLPVTTEMHWEKCVVSKDVDANSCILISLRHIQYAWHMCCFHQKEQSRSRLVRMLLA